MVREILRNPFRRPRHIRLVERRAPPLQLTLLSRLFDASLNLAHRIEIVRKLAPVARTETEPQPRRVWGGDGQPSLRPGDAARLVLDDVGVSEATRGRGVSVAGKVTVALEGENAKLKRLLADAMLDQAALKDLLAKKF